jgi:hypothetical protein
MPSRRRTETHQNHTTMDGYRRWRSSMVEQLICNQQVAGSSPIASSVVNSSGRVPERSKGTDCKSVATGFEGSNPSPSTAATKRAMEMGNEEFRVERSAAALRGAHRGRVWERFEGSQNAAGVAQLVELQPSKLDVAGSRPVSRSQSTSYRRYYRVSDRLAASAGRLCRPERAGVRGAPSERSERMPPDQIAHVAQLAEHVLGKDEVTRSIRVVGSSLS